MHDGITLEQAGIPAPTVVGNFFEPLARSKASSMGLPEFSPVIIGFPLGDREEAVAKADEVYGEVVARLLRSGQGEP